MYKKFILLTCLSVVLWNPIKAEAKTALDLTVTEIEQVKHYLQIVQQNSLIVPYEDDMQSRDFYYDNISEKAGSIYYSIAQNRAVVVFRDQQYISDPAKSSLTSVHLKTITGNVISEYQDLFTHLQKSLASELKEIQSLMDCTNVSFIFTGHSIGGALATIGAAYFYDGGSLIPEFDNPQMHLLTFFSPTVGDQDFVTNFHKKIRIENAINYNYSLKPKMNYKDARSVGIQAQIHPSEYIRDSGGIVSFFRTGFSPSTETQLFLPSYATLKMVIAHYQLGHAAYRVDLDNCPHIEDIGQVSLFSTNRGFLKDLYKLL